MHTRPPRARMRKGIAETWLTNGMAGAPLGYDAQKFLDAVEHLIKGVMPDIAAEENVTIHFWISFAFLITDTHPYHVWVERNYAERFADSDPKC